MRLLRTFASVLIVAGRRLWFTRGLSLAVALGLVAVVALTLSVPLYADAVYHRALLTSIQDELVDSQGIRRPPFSFMFRYQGKFTGPREWADIAAIDQFLDAAAPASIGLPRQSLVRYFETGLARLYAASDAAYADKREPLVWTSVGTAGGLAGHIIVEDGRLPGDAGSSAVEVLASRWLANQLGLQVGEQYILFYQGDKGAQFQVPVVVAGVWSPRDQADPFWFRAPESLNETLLTPEDRFAGALAPQLKGEVSLAVWYMLFDGSGVRSEHVDGLLERIDTTLAQAARLLPGAKLDVSPVEALSAYQANARVLTIQLYLLFVPVLLMVLAYLILVVNLVVGGQRNEIAVLRSRGASVGQVMGIALAQAFLMAAVAVLAASPVASALAQAVGGTRSFLKLAGGLETLAATPVALTWSSLQPGLVAAAAAAILIALPTWEAARHTIITYKQERARSLRAPAWQRAGIDVLLLIPAGYGTYLLQKQGAIVAPQLAGDRLVLPSDPFSNPLLFMVPVLAMLSLTLLVIRGLPWLLRGLAWGVSRLPGTALVLALRHLARSPGFYSAPVLLLALTLALGSFTASLAATLDQHLVNQVRYAVGADMSLDEGGESTRANPGSSPPDAGAADTGAAPASAAPKYVYLPVSDHLKVAGVQRAARVARYSAEAHLPSRNLSGEYFGLDRADFAPTAFWRADFASQPLGTLMNALAATYEGVLVPDSLLAGYALQIGDPLPLIVQLRDGPVRLDLTIVGTFKLWPGWYPNQPDAGPLFVGNLEYMFDRAGGQVPYQVWLKLAPGQDAQPIVAGLGRAGFPVRSYWHAQAMIDQQQMRPERQGLFGMLSVGFVMSGIFTVLGFFLYAVFSLRRRLIELGTLRAIGLSIGQMAVYLGCELAILLSVGAITGTVLGYAASRLYIPFMNVSDSVQATVLPFVPAIAWPEISAIYAVFVLLFVAALAGLLASMRRMRVFEAVKLGEAE